MSPEQLGLTGEDVDTRADIYSLGVLLYELLAGTRPFEPREMDTGHSLVDALRHDEPPKPSTRLSQVADDQQQRIAAARQTDSTTLRRVLAHDLDWIALKAIEKDRKRRYDTANTLAGNLQRYLSDEPIAARPPRGYRLRKFVARHRLAVGAAATILVLIVGSAIVLLIQSARVARERDRAAAEAAKAQTINTFLQDMLSSANPFGTGNRTVTVVDALAAAERRLDSTLGTQPEIAGAVRRTLGMTYEGLGEYVRAERILREAADKSRASGRLQDLALDLSQLGEVLRSQGKFDEALTVAREAVDVGSANGVTPIELASFQFTVAEILRQKGDYDAALRLATEVADARTRLAGPERPALASSIRQLGAITADKGDFKGAEMHYQKALAILRKNRGPEHYEVTSLLNDLAVNYISLSQFEQALATFDDVIHNQRLALGDVHPEVATSLENQANVLYRMKRFPEATAKLEEVLAIRKKALGDDSMPVARTTFNLGMVYSDSGDLARAETNLVDGVARLQRALGPEHPDLVSALRGLAYLRERQGRWAEAESIARQALALALKTVGPDHANTATSHYRLAMALVGEKRYADAEAQLLRARDIRTKALGADAKPTQQVTGELIKLYDAWGKPDKASALKSSGR